MVSLVCLMGVHGCGKDRTAENVRSLFGGHYTNSSMEIGHLVEKEPDSLELIDPVRHELAYMGTAYDRLAIYRRLIYRVYSLVIRTWMRRVSRGVERARSSNNKRRLVTTNMGFDPLAYAAWHLIIRECVARVARGDTASKSEETFRASVLLMLSNNNDDTNRYMDKKFC